MKHAISPSGVIHKVYREGFGHKIEVLCSAGDNTWGNYWRLTSNDITCKRCLAIMNPDKYGSVLITRKAIRRHVQLLENIKEDLKSSTQHMNRVTIIQRLSRLQNELHSKILPKGIANIIQKELEDA
jgi:hypothetical protein